jgi:hypothetical protein
VIDISALRAWPDPLDGGALVCQVAVVGPDEFFVTQYRPFPDGIDGRWVGQVWDAKASTSSQWGM